MDNGDVIIPHSWKGHYEDMIFFEVWDLLLLQFLSQ